MPVRKIDDGPQPLPDIGGTVSQVLSVLSSELCLIYPDIPPGALVQFLGEMQDAMTQTDPDKITLLLNRMRSAGIRDADIADFYVPVVARRLGQSWATDTLEFVEVTIGVSKLHNMLRKLDASWCMPEHAPFGTLGEICVIVPRGVQHSLGANILTGKIRRAGYDVRLGNDLPLDETAQFANSPATMGVMVSALVWETLDFLRSVVEKICLGNRWVPVLIGGNILDRNCDVSAEIGADYATNDWETALSFCAKKVQP